MIECRSANKDRAITLGVDPIRRYHRETPALFVPQQLFTASDAIGRLEARVKRFCALQ